MKLRTTRIALGLYGTLLVLPTLVFGWLYYRELVQDHRQELARVPEDAQDAARRLVSSLRQRLAELIESEERRPLLQYKETYSQADMVGDEITPTLSPLVSEERPEEITAWFQFDLPSDEDDTSLDIEQQIASELEVFAGSGSQGDTLELDRLRGVAERYYRSWWEGPLIDRISRMELTGNGSVPLASMAYHRADDRSLPCLQRCAHYMRDRAVPYSISEFQIEFYKENETIPRAVAFRHIVVFPEPDDLPVEATCLEPLLLDGFVVIQGFFLNVDWLFYDLPISLAGNILKDPEQITPLPETAIPDCGTCAYVRPLVDLSFAHYDPAVENFGQFEVSIDTERLRSRFDNQNRRFLGVASMLVVTLSAGMFLLYRSVRRELDQVQRMQDFVAAVTHELRTPLSTIRLHGEMLLDGWAGPDKQTEYYARIIRETNRLSTLVERILQKSRLKQGTSPEEPQPGDLNEAIRSLEKNLLPPEGMEPDVVFDLAPSLPRVLLLSDAIEGIVSNLVENARKYAPVPPGGEPICVRTRQEGSRILLEVMDRGPGVPPGERDQIFEAFYRVGSESTRTTTGTGLGLHLVELFAKACQGRASYRPRPGGGSIFRVAFKATR